tara:strand:+ start:3153 stop:3986 length:834 start_codon:yes stop_codon:yes gene_type:complete
MKYYIKFNLIFILLISFAFSQDKVEVSYGSGTSTLSNISYKVSDYNNGILFDFSVDRLSSKLKDSKFSFGGPTVYDFDDFFDGYISVLIGITSSSVTGIEMKMSSFDNPNETIKFNLKRLNITLNEWDIFVDENFLEDDFGSLSGKIKFNLQGLSFSVGNELRQSFSPEEIALLSVIEDVIISKVNSELSYFDNILNYEGNITTSLGKCDLELKYLIPRSIYEPVYIDNFELIISNIDQSLKPFLELMFSSSKLPFNKSSNGYSLKMSGTANNPRFY